jgi:hypothetical protein
VITEHAICALPVDHRDWRYLVIRVQRRGNTDRWVLNHDNSYLTADGEWSPSISDATQVAEAVALELAAEWAPLVEVGGRTAADLINH